MRKHFFVRNGNLGMIERAIGAGIDTAWTLGALSWMGPVAMTIISQFMVVLLLIVLSYLLLLLLCMVSYCPCLVASNDCAQIVHER